MLSYVSVFVSVSVSVFHIDSFRSISKRNRELPKTRKEREGEREKEGIKKKKKKKKRKVGDDRKADVSIPLSQL